MIQNVSSAVMAQRHEAPDSPDDFPTPPWATRALMEALCLPPGTRVREPACGRGHMALALRNYGMHVRASDLHDYGVGAPTADFLTPSIADEEVEWVITNPPFTKAQEFAERGFSLARQGVALFVRMQFLQAVERYRSLFAVHRPRQILQFSERPLLLKGRLVRAGDIDPTTGKRPSTATAYCWVVWRHPFGVDFGTDYRWLPPCRTELERPGDYDEMGIA